VALTFVDAVDVQHAAFVRIAAAVAGLDGLADVIRPAREQLNGLCCVAVRQAHCRRLNHRSQLCGARHGHDLAREGGHRTDGGLRLRWLAHLDADPSVSVVGDVAAEAVLAHVSLVVDGLTRRRAELVQHVLALNERPRRIARQQGGNLRRACLDRPHALSR